MSATLPKNVLIHVGYHKCASSLLQWAAFPLMSRNYVWLSAEDLDAVSDAEHFNLRGFRDSLAARVKDPSDDLLILSNENLIGPPHGEEKWDPTATVGNLKRAFPDARVLIIVREQHDYVLSMYTFRVSIKGMVLSLPGFVNRHFEGGFTKKLLFDRICRLYVEKFGAANVTILPFELLSRDRNRFIEKVATVVGRPFPEDVVATHVNPSIKDPRLLTVLRFLNYLMRCALIGLERMGRAERAQRWRWAYQARKRRLIPLLARIRSTRRIGPVVWPRPEFEGVIAESNQGLNELMTFDLADFGYQLPDDPKE